MYNIATCWAFYVPDTISCPGSYPCQRISLVESGHCIIMDAVCDGIEDCGLGDDERDCGELKLIWKRF